MKREFDQNNQEPPLNPFSRQLSGQEGPRSRFGGSRDDAALFGNAETPAPAEPVAASPPAHVRPKLSSQPPQHPEQVQGVIPVEGAVPPQGRPGPTPQPGARPLPPGPAARLSGAAQNNASRSGEHRALPGQPGVNNPGLPARPGYVPPVGPPPAGAPPVGPGRIPVGHQGRPQGGFPPLPGQPGVRPGSPVRPGNVPPPGTPPAFNPNQTLAVPPRAMPTSVPGSANEGPFSQSPSAQAERKPALSSRNFAPPAGNSPVISGGIRPEGYPPEGESIPDGPTKLQVGKGNKIAFPRYFWFLAAGILFLSCTMFMVLYDRYSVTAESMPEDMPVNANAQELPSGQYLDPVSHRPVDHLHTPYMLEIYGTYFYFENRENMELFASDPLKYVKPKIRVKVHDIDKSGEGSTRIKIIGPDGMPLVVEREVIEDDLNNSSVTLPDNYEEGTPEEGAVEENNPDFEPPLQHQTRSGRTDSRSRQGASPDMNSGNVPVDPHRVQPETQAPLEGEGSGYGEVPAPESGANAGQVPPAGGMADPSQGPGGEAAPGGAYTDPNAGAGAYGDPSMGEQEVIPPAPAQ